MNLRGLPEKQGLYDPQFEHDACGIGFVANIKGKQSHDIIEQALTVLSNMEHRGAQGSEVNTGDGAGILIQIPDEFFRAAVKEIGFTLPPAGDYGVGMAFLPRTESARSLCATRFEEIVREEGQEVLGWRDVPTDNSSLGETAKSVEPVIRQVFIRKSESLADVQSFERKLFVIRKRAANELRHSDEVGGESFYFPSLSARTIVYKGMLTAPQVEAYYTELAHPLVKSALALVHSRFSTNTFPNWERAHPNRYLIHNGEINTLRGNVNWMRARQPLLESDLFGDDLAKVMPIIDEHGSDSAMFDNTLEFLILAGRSLPHAAMMMIPEPWSNHESMSPTKKAFYEYHSCLIEPWDGPAAMVFTDGRQIAAVLDRNGLRPARYYVTSDDLIILASEVGVLDIPPEKIVTKERLKPGRMLLVDLDEQRIIADDEIKERIASEHPYREWLDQHLVALNDLPDPPFVHQPDHSTILKRQVAFGYSHEVLTQVLAPMAKDMVDPVGSMGVDTPLAVLSHKPQLLYSYFKQLFAQVTNPPIDALREEIVTASTTTLGPEGNLLRPTPESCRQIEVKSPILSNEEFAKLIHLDHDGWKSATLSTLYEVAGGGDALRRGLAELFESADKAILDGASVLVLSDRGMSESKAPMPALLAVAGLHHHLIRSGTRMKVGLVIESGEPREVHHFALLIGYGASAINPYLVFESLDDMISRGMLTDLTHKDAVKRYLKAASKGVVKVLSKMGISTIQSYHGAQIFEAVGLSKEVVDEFFTWTPSRIEGIGLEGIAKEVAMRHARAFDERRSQELVLDAGGRLRYRSGEEDHLYTPETVHLLQQSCRTNDYQLFKRYSTKLNQQNKSRMTLRGLFKLQPAGPSVPIDEVESVDSIVKRFKTGAMSYGSISKEAHESLAIAMNRIGGKSNTGEGGEDPERFTRDANGDLRRSAIKQVASGRFGVTSHYLVNADELQIKMAQGAKPGEGGQLPGRKVYPWIAEVRHSTPGVGLISPPPHHDIYSIEDLAELIHDLKNSNPRARISVKLVSEVGVGTIAAGVAKGKADLVLISGHDGGTGASPETSIQNAGLPWELGLAETHQTLLLNGLRDRIAVETDGKLMTGRDVAVAALLGAEEFGFATAPLVVLGCVMMRVCHLDTCPVGVATQNPELRKNFTGNPDHVVNFMHFIAQELREIMAELGFRRLEEMIGRSEYLDVDAAQAHWKTKGLDLSAILYRPQVGPDVGRFKQVAQDHGLEKSLDMQELLTIAKPALENQTPVEAKLKIQNVNRVVGTILGSEVTRKYGASGLPEDTIRLHFEGSAGQSFSAFVPRGMTMTLVGDANDYCGKGLSGGVVVVRPPLNVGFTPEENIIIGNVALYGATSGEAYIRGQAGERFAVRNSGAKAVVEGVGDHGCEYMTGGRVVVLGPTGRNFAAGMSGGIAYVYDESGDFARNCNPEMVLLESVELASDVAELRSMIENHLRLTDSAVADRVLGDWSHSLAKFVKVIPKDFKRMQGAIARAHEQGLSGADAVMAAFEENKRDLARVAGN